MICVVRTWLDPFCYYEGLADMVPEFGEEGNESIRVSGIGEMSELIYREYWQWFWEWI